MFLKNVGIKDSNEVEVLTILEALRIYVWLFMGRLLVESDYANAIHWISKVEGDLCKLHFFSFNEIKALSSFNAFSFSNVSQGANFMPIL